MVTGFLIDTSVVSRLDQQPVRTRIAAIGARNIHACAPVLLEVGYTARGVADYREIMATLRRAFRFVAPSPWASERALEVQSALAELGQHRSARLPDLLIAATAEQIGATVLHYDRDFDTIANITAQPCEWVAKPGTLDTPTQVVRDRE